MDGRQKHRRKRSHLCVQRPQEQKRQFRSLWIQRINAAVRGQGMTYSEFMGKMNAKGIRLNRKVLADLAMNNAAAFEKIVKTVK